MRTIGLTGGIATGKSTVAELLQRIAALFGADALQADGSLDRQAVRELIFRDPERRKQLEALLHPAIRELSLRRLEEARQSGAAVAVYMAPLLIEAGAADRVDEIWVVTVRPEVQLERLMTRDGCDRQQAERIVAAQMPLAEKEKYGVVVIDNSGSPEETARQVEEAWQRRIGP